MIKHLSAEDLATEVVLVRASFDGTVMLVEGPTDEKLFLRFVQATECTIMPMNDKNRTLEVLAILEREGTEGILALVDADFWHVESIEPTSRNVVVTDYHDLHVLILCSSAFDHFKAEYCSSEKVRRLAGAHGSLRNTILKRTLPIGLLRFISHRDNLQLDFDRLNYGRVVDRTTLEVKKKKLVEIVLARTRNPDYKLEDVLSKLSEALGEKALDPRQYSCGEDVIEFLSIGLRKAIASRPANTVSTSIVGSSLRLSFGLGDLHATNLYGQTLEWEARNPPFKVFIKG